MRKAAAPKGEVVVEALNLIAGFGGDKGAIKALVADLQKAIEHNERVLKLFQEDLAKREREVTERENAVADAQACARETLQRIKEFRESWDSYERDLKAGKYG